MTVEGTIKVLIVDDSPLTRRVLQRILTSDAHIQVVGMAGDPYEARDCIERTIPDVITLDLEMPRMDGLTFLEKLMKYLPLPVVIVSGLTAHNIRMSLKALELGAVEVVHKPDLTLHDSCERIGPELIRKVKAAAVSRPAPAPPFARGEEPPAGSTRPDGHIGKKVVAIGTSTGGTNALSTILAALPSNLPPIVAIHHLPLPYIQPMVEQLNTGSRIRVVGVSKDMQLESNTVYVAACDTHVLLGGTPGRYHLYTEDGPPVHYKKPSVDLLFRSVGRIAGTHGFGILLTGMGKDGAAGLLEIRRAGGKTLVQDRHSCVVYGLPGEAMRIGAAQKALPLDRIAGEIVLFSESGIPLTHQERTSGEVTPELQ
jgi:two-component system chemotaxis response regulator CheB